MEDIVRGEVARTCRAGDPAKVVRGELVRGELVRGELVRGDGVPRGDRLATGKRAIMGFVAVPSG